MDLARRVVAGVRDRRGRVAANRSLPEDCQPGSRVCGSRPGALRGPRRNLNEPLRRGERNRLILRFDDEQTDIVGLHAPGIGWGDCKSAACKGSRGPVSYRCARLPIGQLHPAADRKEHYDDEPGAGRCVHNKIARSLNEKMGSSCSSLHFGNPPAPSLFCGVSGFAPPDRSGFAFIGVGAYAARCLFNASVLTIAQILQTSNR